MTQPFLIITPDDFTCPACNTEFDEEQMMEICGEPFNGAVIECASCKREWSVTVRFEITESS